MVDGTSNTGRLEVCHQGEWVTFCSNGWSDLNTRIACKQLGFPDGQAMYTVNQTFYHRRIGIANTRCSGNEHHILSCPHNPVFRIDSSCSHRRDVFLRCLCSDCDDYTPTDIVRLADRPTPISGRLEVFSWEGGWGGVCSYDWTEWNSRVACRQLGFRDGARAYTNTRRQSVTFALFNVRCTGYESSLLHCSYSTSSTQGCTDPIYIRCECSRCPNSLLREPQQLDATTQSTQTFEWIFDQNINDYEIAFLTQKNPNTLFYVRAGNVVKENTRFKHRIRLINVDNRATVAFNLTNISTTDMGVFLLYVQQLLLSSKAILIVKNFAVVPDGKFASQVHESVSFGWHLTPLRQLRDVELDILLTTPATGRLHLDYYYTHWLPDNPGRHSIPQQRDYLHPTVVIDDVTVSDAGRYVIEVMLTSSVHRWLNASWRFSTTLVVAAPAETITSTTADYYTHRINTVAEHGSPNYTAISTGQPYAKCNGPRTQESNTYPTNTVITLSVFFCGVIPL